MKFQFVVYKSSWGRFVWMLLIYCLLSTRLWAHGVGYHEFAPVDRRLGLDATVVYSVVQDQQGLLWMGTNQGLYSFDGYWAQLHSLDEAQGQNPSGVVYCTMMPDSVHLWLGAESGLLVFNTFTDRFEAAPPGLPDNIRAIERIDNHTFWIGSMNGLYRFDASTGRAERIKESALPNQAVYSILKYDATNYYFGTYNGLCHYDAATDQFETVHFGVRQGNANQLILSLLADPRQRVIWIGVEGGLWQYHPQNQEFREMPLFKGNSIKSLLIDNQHCLWAGSDNGLFIYNPVNEQYRLIRHDALNDRSLINNIVWTVFADRDQNIWLGTDGGVSLYTHNSRYQKQSITELTGSSEGNQIISLLADSKGRLWLGGTNGLILKEKGKTVWYQQNSTVNPIPHNKVRNIYEDRDGMIWIATDGSICRYDETRGQFVRYLIEDEMKVLNANWAYAISEDQSGKMWIATCLGGVFVVDKQKLIASNGSTVVADRNYFSHSGANSLSGNMLQGIQPDVDGNFWVSTYRAGLNKVDVANQKIVQFTEHSSQHKLFSDEVSAISVDNSKPYVWVAMRNRVVRMNIRDYHQDEMTDSRLTDSYINGMADDGQGIWLSTTAGLFVVDKSTLELKQVNVGIAYFSAIGYSSVLQSIIVGGVNELVTFNPRTVLDDDRQNALCITAMWVNDKLVQPNLPQSMALDRSLRFTHTIELPANENNLLLAFSGFRYSDGAGVQYVYQLEGEDAYWRYTDGSTNRISYNNLRPGKYVLQIARVGSDGKPMSHPLRLAVTILHPWYSTLLAKIIYLLLLGALVLAIFNYWVMLHRLRYERMEKVKTMELTNHKIEFLTNISHELKTPLSLIVGPLSRLIEQVKTPVLKETLEGVRQNALKMSTLLHQLMEASRQDTTGFELVTASTDIVLLLRSIVAFFEKPLAARDVRIELSANVDSVSIVGDVLKLESVFNNILSNAAKFAPDHSLITVKVDASENQIEVVVMDEGPGIPPADLPLVFDRFFQSQHSLTQNNEGSGVGLSIVKEYVQLHGGTVNALSDGQHGTTIKVMLPRSFEMTESADAFTVQARQRVDDISVKPVVLIVEDNEEILSFLANALSREFKCHTALNGKLGFEAALEMNPDIIVTDIMMSVMDGLAMCRKLKDNVTTANIPVVMLTAKDDKNTELSGYRTGADAFIAKPFEVSYLSDRLHLLLQGRQHLVQKARQQAIIQPKEIEAVSADEKFLQTITKIIEEEITQEDLNVNWLSEKSGYSAKQVYRRIKALTGQTAVDYIRTVKLKKAALLLSKKTFTVAEVMYMVGFNNHSYFAKRFHEMYGKSPKQFMEEA